eukprot:jgi/Bigna1/84896/estExt_fgenesh1_pg.C_10309
MPSFSLPNHLLWHPPPPRSRPRESLRCLMLKVFLVTFVALQYHSSALLQANITLSSLTLVPGRMMRVMKGGGRMGSADNSLAVQQRWRPSRSHLGAVISRGGFSSRYRSCYTSSAHSSSSNEDEGFTNDKTGIRINKCFKEFVSRRESDRYVADGRVQINGVVAKPGARVFPGDCVTLDGKPVSWEKLAIVREDGDLESQFVYIKYWKPRGVICTTDTRIEGNIIDAVSHPKRIYPVGRLDKDTSGLILLTSDGRVPNSILRSILHSLAKKNKGEEEYPTKLQRLDAQAAARRAASGKKSKEYRVEVNRAITERHLTMLREGVLITTVAQRDRKAKPLTAYTLPAQVERIADNKVLMTIYEGRNRQIRKMMEALGYKVVKLHRLKVMGIDLDRLVPGSWVPLNEIEMKWIRGGLSPSKE